MPACITYTACTLKKHSTQYTIRDIPNLADSRLRETAATEQISLNQAAIQALERGLGIAGQPIRYRSLRHLIPKSGEVDAISWAKTIAEMDQINPEDWK